MLRPSGAISSGLFRQFTVLSNHPAYQGFLSHVYDTLATRGLCPGDSRFAARFRDAEILWGIINGKAKKSILNVTKYARYLDLKDFSLPMAQREGSLYAKLAYGTLGHYSTPSLAWGLLQEGGKTLSEQGKKLGQRWSERETSLFARTLEAWLQGKGLDKITGLAQAEEHHHLEAEPSDEERLVWTGIVDRFCEKHPVLAPLWQRPPTSSIQALASSEDTRPSWYPALVSHYVGYPELQARIDSASQFELLSGLCQFVFEWEYVSRLEEVRKAGLGSDAVVRTAAERTISLARAYTEMSSRPDSGTLFRRLAASRGDQEVARTILEHHISNQQAKGAVPFIRGNEVTVRDRVDHIQFAQLVRGLAEDLGGLEKCIRWRYGRGWHFERARKWLQYSGAVQ